MVRSGAERCGSVGSGLIGFGMGFAVVLGVVLCGLDWRGFPGVVCRGMVRNGGVGSDTVRVSRCGTARYGRMRCG